DIVDRRGDLERRPELVQPRLERGSNETPGRIEHPAPVERVILRLVAAPGARLRSSRLDQYQTFGRQYAAGQVAGDRVVRREEGECHIELAGADLVDELLPEIGAQHRLKLGEATRQALDRRDEARLRERV